MDDNNNLPAEIPTTDIAGKELEELQAYMDAGMPDIGSITDDQIVRMTDLYLTGKNYKEISVIMRCPKKMILFLSHKLQWYDKRQEYLTNLHEHNHRKLKESKLLGQEFLIDYTYAEQKRMSENVKRYLATGDEKFLDRINGKNLERWMKAFETLQKSSDQAKEKGPLVGINVTEGATLTRTGENTIEVTPKQKAMGDMLKELADMRRAEEKKRSQE